MFARIKGLLAGATAAAILTCAVPAASAPDSDVVRATLDNGLRVIVVRNTLAPIATEIINYLVGSSDTPAGFPGMAHAEEHMVAGRSTRDVSAAQVASIETLLGGDSDADTQNAVTQYNVTTTSQNLDVALRLEAARMRGALDLQSEWSEERGAIEQEVSQDLSSAFYRYYEKALAIEFAGTPYDHDALGTRASFDHTTGAMLKKFYDTWYAPNNAILVISGDVDPQATLAQIKTIFGSIPRRAVPAHAKLKLAPVPANATIRDQSDFPVPLALLSYRMPGYRDPDYAATEIAFDVLQSPRSDFSGLVYSGKALQTGADYEPQPQAGLGYTYIAIPPGGDTSAALQTLDDVVKTYQEHGVPADLVEAQKKREIAQDLFSRNSIEGLANDWSQAVAIQGLNSPDDMLALFRAVTADDVTRVFRKYFVRKVAIAGILTPAPGAVPSSNGSIGVKDTFSSTASKPVPLPIWASQLQMEQIPKSTLSPVDVTLSNGIRLIVQPLSISPTVTLRGQIKSEPALQTPPGQEGTSGVLQGLFNYGTTNYDRLAFQTQLDDIAADVSAGTSFSLSVPSEGFERGLELLADNLLHPALPAPAFAIVRQQTQQELEGEIKSPDYLASRALANALLPKDDPALRHATPASVAALSLEGLKSYYASVYRPDLTTIVIAGDVTPERARALVEKYFGAWTVAGPKPETQLPPVPLNAPATANVTAPGRTQTSVTLSETLEITRLDPDYYALQLGNTVLGGSFYSSRFYRDLRLKNGLVYYVGGQLQAGKTRASYEVEYACDPQNVSKARVIVDRELRTMASADVSDEELRSAKTQILRDLPLQEGSVDSIVDGFVARSIADLPLDTPTRRAEATVGITAPQVRAAFAKWIDPARFVQVNEGPAK
jgi:zinc protease